MGKKQKSKKSKKKNKTKDLNQMEVYDSIRKPLPPKTRVINPDTIYDRKDKSWKDLDPND